MVRTPDVSTNIRIGQLFITVAGYPEIKIDPTDYPQALVEYAALHGFKQRYVDAAALGEGSTLAEKHAAIMVVVNHHRDSGEWSRQGQGDGTPGDGLLVRAIAEFDGCGMAEARELVAKMDKKTQAAMRASDALRPIIERWLKVAPAPKVSAVDVSALLSALRVLP